MFKLRIILILAASFLVSSVALAGEVTLTLDEAIRQAMTNNHEIKAYQSGVESADAARKQARGRYGPVLNVSSNVLVWDDETELSLGGGGAMPQLPPPATPYEQAVSGLISSLASPSKIQDQITSETQVMVAMPLNQLYQIHQGYKIESLNKAFAESELKTTTQDTILDVVSAYFGLLQANQQLEIANKSVSYLEEQFRVVQAFFDQGMMAKNDLLKIKVALADANQKQIQTKAMTDLARANLATVMGMDINTNLSTVAFPTHAPAPPTRTIHDATVQAMNDRPELMQVTYRTEQANRGYKAAIANMFPNLSLVGAYTHTEGVQMGREDTFFAGVMLEWNAWEWGATYFGINKAKHQRNQTAHMKSHLEGLVKLQIIKAKTDFNTAVEILTVAKAAMAEAEESYSIEAQNIAKGMGTTADMLEAEASLTRAKSNYASAIYACYIAKATFLKAIGEPIESAKL